MPQPDDRIIALLENLQACLCAELTPPEAEEPPLCLCIPIPGSYPAQTYAGTESDVAWVRLVDYFPSNSPGVQAQLPFNQVQGRTLMIETGVMRCYELNSDGMHDSDDLLKIWTQQIHDLGSLERAIVCCTGSTWDENQFVVGNYVPSTDGDMVGGSVIIAMQIE